MYSLQERWTNVGRVEGKAEGVFEFLLKLIKQNHPIEDIIEYSGLSKEDIESLMNESQDAT